MSTEFKTVKAADVRPGDMAHRIDRDLDPRPVADVLPGTPRLITLKIGQITTDPIPARWYRFTREVSA